MEYTFVKARKPLEPSATISFSLQALVINLQHGEWTFDQFGDGRRIFDMKHGEGSFGIGKTFRQGGRLRPVSDREIL